MASRPRRASRVAAPARAAQRLEMLHAPSLPRRFALAATLVLSLAAARAASPRAAPEQSSAPAGDLEVAPGEAHRYPVTLDAGQTLDAHALQLAGDVVLRLLGADGGEVARADAWERPGVEEELVAIAAAAGAHLLEVTPVAGGPAARYRLRLEPPRTATAADRERADLLAAHQRARAMDQAPAGAAALAWNEVAARWRDAGERAREADALWRRGMAERRDGRAAEAVATYGAALAPCAASGDRACAADLENSLGLAQRNLGDMAAAQRHLGEALALFAALGDRRNEAAALSNLALVHQATGDRQTARKLLLRSVELARAAGERRTEAKSLINLGLVYDHLGEAQDSLRCYRQALGLARELGDRSGEAAALHNIAAAYEELGHWEEALPRSREALALVRAAGDRRGEAAALNNLGLLHWRLGEPAEAERQFAAARALAAELGDRRTESTALSNLALLRRERGDLTGAAAALERALALAREVGDRESEARAEVVSGSVALERGEPEMARRSLARARELAQGVGARGLEADALLLTAKLETRSGAPRAALPAIEAAVALVEGLRAEVGSAVLRSSFRASRAPVYETWIEVLMDLHRAEPAGGHDAAALGAAERAKARSLLETLGEARAELRQGADPELLAAERRARQEVNARELDRVASLGAGAPVERREAAAAALTAALAELRRVEDELRVTSPRYAALTQPRPLDLAAIRREVLDGDTALVEIALGEDRSFLWVVTGEALASAELPARATLEEMARAAYGHLTARNRAPAGETVAARRERVEAADAAWDGAARALAGHLLTPARALLGERRLVVVADGALQYLPFAALPDPVSGEPLVARREVVTLPSASVLAVLRHELAGRAPAARTLAVVADPVFSADDGRVARAAAPGDVLPAAAPAGPLPETPGVAGPARRGDPSEALGGDVPPDRLPRLHFSRREAEAIAAFVPPAERLLALDFAAARPLVDEGRLAGYRLLHFATHGLLDSRHPELSSLVLSLVDETGAPRDGYLRLHAIYNLRLDADLVVLSACRTALGREVRGEGLVGLTRGFMYAGAPRVVASLWSVEDRATAELMKRFYRGMLEEGLRPAAALRAAQRALAAEPRWRSPYHWSAFTLQGEWR